MHRRAARVAAALLALWAFGGCSVPLGPRQYEYEEQIFLSVDGGATAIVDASIPALVALRGAKLDPAPSARLDQDDVRRVFERGGCQVVNVGQPWRRKNRRFVQVRIATTDVRTLSSCTLFAWSTYTFDHDGAGLHFLQTVGASAGGDPGKVNWDGSELVAFKLHLPSRIVWHNVRKLEDGSAGDVERGNILTWEQTLADRQASKPLTIEVRMETESILYRTIWLFGGAFGAAVIVLVTIIWMTVRRGRKVTL
jgi:hypothetical protein